MGVFAQELCCNTKEAWLWANLFCCVCTDFSPKNIQTAAAPQYVGIIATAVTDHC